MKINDLQISEEIKHALSDMGYEEYTPIQEETIPLCLEGKDVIGQSQTGTGKTAAFAIPILERIDPNLKKPQAMILCPTRELAVQVADEFKKIAKYKEGIRSVAVYGGEPINRQIMTLRKGAQVIIGTPGRTIDHITKRRTLKTDDINMMVLDEADEMLKMGFREDIELILESIKDDRQTILFSATMPKPILNITKKYQKEPVLIKVKAADITADTIKQEYCETKTSHKLEALMRLLAVNNSSRCLVFCNKKRIVDNLNDELLSKGINTEKIHGDLKQVQRMSVLRKFNRAIVNVLVATDVAARGLDIQDVDLIINYDVPEKEEYYVHRIGRSGRAGKDGHAITLVASHEKRKLINIMHYTKKKIGKIKIPTMTQVNSSKINVFINDITATIQNENLDDYKNILNQIDTMFTIEDICASLIKKNLELEEITHENDINVKLSHSNTDSRGYERPRRKNDEKRNKNREKSKRDKDMVRIFITIGKKDDVKPKHILGAIAGECNINGKYVGAIDVLNNFTFADVHKDHVKKVVKKLDGNKINSKKVAVELAKRPK